MTTGTGTITFSNDTTKLQTIANFFPKGDTRYASQAGAQTLTNKTISGTNNTITNIGNSSLTNSTISGVALGGNLNALSQGTGISSFSYNGSATGSVAVDQTFSPTWTGKHIFNNSVTASSGTAQGIAITPSLTAAANNDVLAAMDVTPTYTDGAFTGVHITIQAEANWPDYVFSDKYKLQPLSEVAAYLHANHHLPDMPSADEVAKNGQDLGAMNSTLVKKVEELTLYLIDKDKQLEDQKKIIADQQTRLEKIEKLLKIDKGN